MLPSETGEIDWTLRTGKLYVEINKHTGSRSGLLLPGEIAMRMKHLHIPTLLRDWVISGGWLEWKHAWFRPAQLRDMDTV